MGLRVLVADDDVLILKLMRRLLKSWGEVDAAGSGDEALALWSKAFSVNQPYDLLCLDIKMPGDRDGQATLKAIRDIESENDVHGLSRCKIIMVTGYRDADNVMLAFKEQSDGYLVKPVSPEQLATTLRDLGFASPAAG